MRVVVAHNYYKQAGGEDQVVAAEVAMLRQHGHDVTRYCLHNDAIDQMPRTELVARTIWNRSSYLELRALVRESRAHIVHFHNTFPLMSPSAYYAARAEGAAVVQTLHNFRLTCAGALLLRDGKVCEDCLGSFAPWQGVWRKCYRGNLAASATVTAMLAAHRVAGTWRNAVDVYVALTEFGRRKFEAAGLPADRVVVKSNFVFPDPGPGTGGGGYAMFVGRLSAEKGLGTLLEAWRQLGGQVPLRIVGDGPMAPQVKEAAARDPAIQWMGSVPLDSVYRLMGGAAFAVVPSVWFEGFPRVMAEAFAKGTPLIASRMGAMAELIQEGRTGLLFTPGDALELAQVAQRLFHDTPRLTQMRRSARLEFEEHYTAERNHEGIMAIYARALSVRSRKEPCC
ncbi:glycosyltransferase [Craurococcus roseus]|uniref:Glycosyltransferase n=2 Tax=Craurococcus roseus TaxID=77585 RepID=A0ABN1FW14_9PROT